VNQIRTAALLLMLTSILTGIGALLDAWTGALTMLALAAIFNGYTFWYSHEIALRVYDAQGADPILHARLICVVHDLANRAGIPAPAIHVTEAGDANAFATGRSPQQAAIIVALDLLRALDNEELAGVMAHELAHIRSRDALTLTVTATIAGAIAMLGAIVIILSKAVRGSGAVAAAALGLMTILPAILLQFAIGRGREYAADRNAAHLCGTPAGLIRALEKLASHHPAPMFSIRQWAVVPLMFVPWSGRWPKAQWRRSMIARGRAANPALRSKPKHGWLIWPVARRRTSAIRTNCGRRGFSHSMPASMGLRKDMCASPIWCRARSAKSSTRKT
jgi:heat shock protein HtpX